MTAEDEIRITHGKICSNTRFFKFLLSMTVRSGWVLRFQGAFIGPKKSIETCLKKIKLKIRPRNWFALHAVEFGKKAILAQKLGFACPWIIENG